MHLIGYDLKSVFTKQTECTSCFLNIVQHDIATFKLIKWHAWIHLLYFTMACAVSEQIQTVFKPYLNPFLQVCFFKLSAERSAWTYIFILSSIQYIYIPASNITTQLLVCCCDTAFEPDFRTIHVYLSKMHEPLLCSYYSEEWWKPMLELPTTHYFLSIKIRAAHWAAHYVIQQSELQMGSPWSAIINRLKVSWRTLLVSCSCASHEQIW